MIIIMLRYFEVFPAVKDRWEPFQNITLNVKQFQESSEKHLREETANVKIFTG